MYRNLEDMRRSVRQHLVLEQVRVTGFVDDELPPGAVDAYARNAIFNPDPTVRTQMRQILRSAAACRGIRSESLAARLDAKPDGVLLAVRLGGHCYDLARLVLRSARARGVSGLVFEQGWAGQSPWEFSALLAAAALREGWPSPLYLRCGLPPLASDLLPGGGDIEAAGDLLTTARSAEILNLTLRVSPAGLARPRSSAELHQLAAAARERGMCVGLRVDEPSNDGDTEEVLDALRALARRAAPHLLVLSADGLGWPPARAAAWLEAMGGRGVALSGLRPAELLERALPSSVLEVRAEFDWAERIVMHPEFRAERRREVLDWLRRSRQGGLLMTDSALLRAFEYQALGHFEFELWDLDGMPGFREDFMGMLDRLYERLGLAG